MKTATFKKMSMRTIGTATLASIAINAYAMGSGFYLGLMMGPATNSGKILQAQVKDPPPPPIITTPAKPRSQQFAARIFAGNQFSPYAAIELGLTFFSQIKYNTEGVETAAGVNQRVRDIDLVGKGILPFYCFDVYAKGGMTLTYFTTAGGLNPTFLPATPTRPAVTHGSTSYRQKFSPTFSVGFSYDINQSWQTDISANYILVGSNVGNVIYYALGISYHFTDKYCGQFLCDD